MWRWLDMLAHRMGWCPQWVCDRRERRLLLSLAAAEARDGVTVPRMRAYRCDHASVSGTGLVGARCGCGCEMAEV
jgi:hypothetical protein